MAAAESTRPSPVQGGRPCIGRPQPPSLPPVLVSLFGSRAKSLLHVAAFLVVEAEGGASSALAVDGVARELLRPTDPLPYRRVLLDATAVLQLLPAPTGFTRDDPIQQRMASGRKQRQLSSQAEIIQRTVDSLLRSNDPLARDNVICTGFKKRRPGMAGGSYGCGGTARGLMAGAQALMPNGRATAELLNTAEWGVLLSRMGDAAMLRLLRTCSLFLPLDNRCLMQVAGESLVKVAQRHQLMFPGRPQPLPIPSRLQPRLPTVERPAFAPAHPRDTEPASPRTQDGEHPSPAAPEDDADSALAAMSVDGDEGLAPPTRREVGRQRPSSWQRRKRRRAGGAGTGVELEVQHGEGDGRVAGEAEEGPATQEPPSSVRQPSYGNGPAAPASAPAAVDGPPRGWLSPTQRLIPRFTAFYHASFAKRAGLTSSNLLSQAAKEGNAAGAARLYAAIFLESTSPTSACLPRQRLPGAPGSFRVWRALPDAPRRIPPHVHRSVLPLLQRMIDNVRRCPFNTLLERHCPLPPNRRSRQETAPVSSDQTCFTDGRGGGVSDSTSPATQPSSPHSFPSNETVDAMDCTSGGQPSFCATHHAGLSSLAGMSMTELAAAHVPHRAVEAFVWGCLTRLCGELLGSPSSAARRGLRASVRHLIGMTRYEAMSVQQAAQGVPAADLPWLPGAGQAQCGPALQAKRHRWLVLWAEWVLGGLVLPLLRAHFYITETETRRLAVAYYRKPVWFRLKQVAVEGCTTRMYRELSGAEVSTALSGRSWGVASLRLVPKRDGARPIVNLGSRSTVRLFPPRPYPRPMSARQAGARRRRRPVLRTFNPVNWTLRNPQKVLSAAVAARPELLGASIFGLNDAYALAAPFLRRHRNATAAGDAPMPFVIHVDVRHAFDSVDIERVTALLAECIPDGRFAVSQHAEVSPAQGSCRVAYRRCAVQSDPSPPPPPPPLPFPSPVTPATDASGAHTAAARSASRRYNAVYVDQDRCASVSGREAKSLLRQHLRGNYVRLPGRWLHQTRGIPQGSVASSLLCSLYLADLEAAHLRPILRDDGGVGGGGSSTEAAAVGGESGERPPSLMLRLIDDFLIVTYSRTTALALVHRMHAGFPDYGVVVNGAKTAVNFDTWVEGAAVGRREVVEESGRRFIAWCGLLVNSDSLELQADYSRLTACHLRCTMTLPLNARPAAKLSARLCLYIRPKCHPLLLDTTINSPATVRVNIYQAFLLAAMKFHIYLAALPRGVDKDARLASHAIGGVLGRMGAAFLRVWRRVDEEARQRQQQQSQDDSSSGSQQAGSQQQRAGQSSAGLSFQGAGTTRPARVSPCHIHWLGLHAFRAVLLRKRAAYASTLLPWLERAMAAERYAPLRHQLAAVVDPQRHTSLFRIRF